MRQLADVMSVQANREGDLRLSVDTDEVKVDTQWTKCVIPNMGKSNSYRSGLEDNHITLIFCPLFTLQRMVKTEMTKTTKKPTNQRCVAFYCPYGVFSSSCPVMSFRQRLSRVSTISF